MLLFLLCVEVSHGHHLQSQVRPPWCHNPSCISGRTMFVDVRLGAVAEGALQICTIALPETASAMTVLVLPPGWAPTAKCCGLGLSVSSLPAAGQCSKHIGLHTPALLEAWLGNLPYQKLGTSLDSKLPLPHSIASLLDEFFSFCWAL